jgi:cation diffusion facilitator family transporter
MAETVAVGTTRRSVLVSFAVNCVEVIGLGLAAWISHSVALGAETATNAADVAVGVFLLIGVVSSERPPDDTHPLGYGRERFFWSLFAALGIFIGGGGLALDQAVSAALHPSPVHSYLVAYLVLAVTFVLDSFSFAVAVRQVRAQAADRRLSLRRFLLRTTDPASMTVFVAGGCAVIGAVVASVGLVASQLARSGVPDTAAGALIGVMLLIASGVLLQTNRALLTGRGVSASTLHEMRSVIAAQPGVIGVPDLFAVVIGPSSLVVDGDIMLAANLDISAAEETIKRGVLALRERWPRIEYVYLTPVAQARPSRAERRRTRAAHGG